MSLRRGFKAEAERLGEETRAELGLSAVGRFDPLVMAEHLGIPVIGLRDLKSEHTLALSYFKSKGSAHFSAVTVYAGRFRVIVHNDSHAPTRQASNLTHELSHSLLEHPPNEDLTPEGCLTVNTTLEDEADWLMGVLLVPRRGALTLAREGASDEQIAQRFGVSDALCRWRLGITGISVQLGRTRSSTQSK